MNKDTDAFNILNRLEWGHIFLVLLVLISARVVMGMLSWLFPRLAEKVPARWRLTILQFMPIARLLVALAVVVIIIPILIRPTFQNVVALLASAGLAFAFALKDYASSMVAAFVTIFEKVYQPGDWIEVDGTYGEVRSVGLRAVRLVTADDTEVIIPHTKIWNASIFNATSGHRHLLCVADFYLDPEHDAAQVQRKLEETASVSPYRQPDSAITVVVFEKPWGTHYRVKAYCKESRDQFRFISDLTVRGKAVLMNMGVKAARVPFAETKP